MQMKKMEREKKNVENKERTWGGGKKDEEDG